MKTSRVLLFSLCIIIAISHIAYVLTSRQYPQWDEHNYLSLAIKYYDIFRSPSIDLYQRMLSVTGYLQPLYSGVIAFFLVLLGTSHTYMIALLLNGVFYIFTILGTFFLAREFFDETVSFVAALIFAFYGNALFYLHFTYTETAVTVFIVWSIIYLIRSKGFRYRNSSILSAIFFACAVMTRWVALVFVVGPILLTTVTSISKIMQTKAKKKYITINIFLFFIIAILLPLILYFIPNADDFFSYVQRNQEQGGQWVVQYRDPALANTFSIRSIMYYFNILSQNTIVPFIFFALGMLLCLRFVNKYIVLLLAFLIPYAFLTFITIWKEDRFLVPLYPTIAIISSITFAYIKQKNIQRILILIIGFVSIFNFLGASWGRGPLGKRGLTDYVLPSFIHHPRRIYLTPIVWPPTKEYLNAHVIAEAIRKSWNEPGVPVVGSHYTFEPLDNAFGSIVGYHDRSLMTYVKSPYETQSVDYLMTKSNDTLIDVIKNNEFLESFQLIANIPIPMDNSMVSIYKKDGKK